MRIQFYDRKVNWQSVYTLTGFLCHWQFIIIISDAWEIASGPNQTPRHLWFANRL